MRRLCWVQWQSPRVLPHTLEPFLAFSALSWRCAVSRASPSSSVAVTSDVTTRCAVSVATYRKLRTTELSEHAQVWVMAATWSGAYTDFHHAAMRAQLPQSCCSRSWVQLSRRSIDNGLTWGKVCSPMHTLYVSGAAHTQPYYSLARTAHQLRPMRRWVSLSRRKPSARYSAVCPSVIICRGTILWARQARHHYSCQTQQSSRS